MKKMDIVPPTSPVSSTSKGTYDQGRTQDFAMTRAAERGRAPGRPLGQRLTAGGWPATSQWRRSGLRSANRRPEGASR